MIGDVLRGLRRLACKGFDFLGHDGEAAAGFTRSDSLDRRIERKHIGLPGDSLDESDDRADVFGFGGKRIGGDAGLRAGGGRIGDDTTCLRDLPLDLADRRRQFFRCARDGADVCGGFDDGARCLMRLLVALRCNAGELGRNRLSFS